MEKIWFYKFYIPIVLFERSMLEPKSTQQGKQYRFQRFILICGRSGSLWGYFWPKLTTSQHGSKNFTLLFYFYERKILRLKSTQQDNRTNGRDITIFSLMFNRSGSFLDHFQPESVKKLPKMAKYGCEIFTFIFYYFEKNILRLKSVQWEKQFRFQLLVQIQSFSRFEVLANFSQFWEENAGALGQKWSYGPKNWLK